jgi:hypothetical protein
LCSPLVSSVCPITLICMCRPRPLHTSILLQRYLSTGQYCSIHMTIDNHAESSRDIVLHNAEHIFATVVSESTLSFSRFVVGSPSQVQREIGGNICDRSFRSCALCYAVLDVHTHLLADAIRCLCCPLSSSSSSSPAADRTYDGMSHITIEVCWDSQQQV